MPGYYLKNAVLTDYDVAGNPGIRIEAERIDQIAHGNEVALYNIRVLYQPPNGQPWVMVGDVAHVEPDGKVVDVTGNVRLQSEATRPRGHCRGAHRHLELRRRQCRGEHQERRAHRFRATFSDRARDDRQFERAHDALRIESQWPLPPLKPRLLALAWVALALPASRAWPTPVEQQTILLDAQSIEMDFKNNNLLYRKVRISQGNMAVTADQAQTTGLDFDDSHWVFRGNVKITMDQGQLTSDEAEITFAKKLLSKAVVNGKPAAFEQRIEKTGKMAQGRAETIDYDVRERRGASIQERLVERRPERRFAASR